MARSIVCVALIVITAPPAGAAAQFPPDSFTNLQVLPDSITQAALLATMREFTFALGVTCQHCHAGTEATPLDSIDFASDEKRTKRTARVMLRMVATINNQHLRDVPARPTPEIAVRCVTCHRGLPRPFLIQDVLAQALAQGGAEEAVSRYRALREQYYGSGAYDFSAETLNEFGLSLIRKRRLSEAAALLRLSAELNPRSMTSHFYLGEAYRAQGDTARALAGYRRALEIEPDQALIRRLVERLTTGRP